MLATEDTIVVFTARSPERIVREGGSQAWALNVTRARDCSWVVCTQNRHHPDHAFSDATEPHGSAFLLGKISSIRRAEGENEEERWMIAISEFARLQIPNLWDGSRNPVRYRSLTDLPIDSKKLKFQPMPAVAAPSIAAMKPEQLVPASNGGLTIPEAKKALAATFGVKPDAVEITIRG